MAGEKLSIRQQMINMMYLVLTAMLALQVSSSIMDKFIFLNASLEHSLEASKDASEAAISALQAKVKKEGNSRQGLQSIKRAQDLKKETTRILDEINKVKTELIQKAGGGIDPKTGAVKNPKEETKVETMMIGPENSKSGKAYTLKKTLDGYVEYLYKTYSDLGFKKGDGLFLPLAEGNKDNPLYKRDPIQRNKDFAQAGFQNTPVVAALALLTQKQNEVIRYEQEVLKKLGGGDLSRDLKFDQIIGMASADANIIAAGTEYTAEMFITATSSKTKSTMTYNGKPVQVEDGVGKVKFIATGTGEQEWTGKITFENRGEDTTLTFKKKYTVVEPVLLVNSATINPLYRNCANPLITSVPALGASYEPSYSVSNGQAIPGAKKGEVTIFPGGGAKCVLSVSSGGKAVGQKEFDVLPVPPPNVALANRSGNPINTENPIPGTVSVQVKAFPDENFARALPKEATYRVVGLEVRQFRGGRAIANNKVNGSDVNLQQYNSRPGDGFQIKVTAVQRVNSRGSIESAPVKSPYVSFFVR